MRFQRSGFRPYDSKSVISINSADRPRRLWRVRPRTILLVIIIAIIAAFVADRKWIRGNGIVAGELTAISPIVQARLQRLLVSCLDRVTRGQRLAEFDNEITAEAAGQQLQHLQLQLTQARAQIEIADRQAEAAHKLVEAQTALWTQQRAVFQAEDQLKQRQY